MNFKELFVNDDDLLILRKELACLVGINEAIVLNQLNYWIEKYTGDKVHMHDGKCWIYNSYKGWEMQFPFWSTKTISRVFTSLENKGVLSSTSKYNKLITDRTKWYTINYDRLEEISSQFPIRTSCPIRKGQNGVLNTKEYLSKSTLLEGVENDTMNPNKTETAYDENIVEREINKSLSTVGIKEQPMRDEMMNVVLYYYEAYRNKFGIEHPRISQKNMDKVIEKLRSGTDLVADADLEQYMQMIDKYLNTVYPDCNYSILHFISDGIMDNKFYETCY